MFTTKFFFCHLKLVMDQQIGAKKFRAHWLNKNVDDDDDDDDDDDYDDDDADMQYLNGYDDNNDNHNNDDDDDKNEYITAAQIDECWTQLSTLLLDITMDDSHPLCSAYKNLLRDTSCEHNGEFSPWKNELHMMLYLLLCSQKFAVNISTELIKFLIIMFKTLKKNGWFKDAYNSEIPNSFDEIQKYQKSLPKMDFMQLKLCITRKVTPNATKTKKTTKTKKKIKIKIKTNKH